VWVSCSAFARDEFEFYKAKFYTTHDDLKIIAVGGKHVRNVVFIVLGETAFNANLELKFEGILYYCSCPWPPSDGQLSRFSTKSPPQK